ncbi:hypothetical protein [Streptomyces sp. NPDC051776]|uniref:hypothetical protein n=1 Tax=Streptomyces sp. NPDC051776 TaxID=3155414 RepID=UPI00343102DF
MSWVDIDYDLQRWVEIPATDEWNETPWDDEKDWSRSAAHVLLAMNEIAESRREVRRVAKVLVGCREVYRNSALGESHYLYFDSVAQSPIAIHLWFGPAEGERTATLRQHVRADNSDTMRIPQVTDFPTEHYGVGLRSLNHVLLEDQSIAANLWYALRDDEKGVDIIAFASTGELGRLVAAEPDFDEFVRGIRVFADDEGGWAEAQGVGSDSAD